jgi:hypothetical protein
MKEENCPKKNKENKLLSNNIEVNNNILYYIILNNLSRIYYK